MWTVHSFFPDKKSQTTFDWAMNLDFRLKLQQAHLVHNNSVLLLTLIFVYDKMNWIARYGKKLFVYRLLSWELNNQLIIYQGFLHNTGKHIFSFN